MTKPLLTNIIANLGVSPLSDSFENLTSATQTTATQLKLLAALSSSELNPGAAEIFAKTLLGEKPAKKEISGPLAAQWLLVGGPVHGETREVSRKSNVVTVVTSEPLIPEGVKVPKGKSYSMIQKSFNYHRRDIVVGNYCYRLGVLNQEEFAAIPFNEIKAYIEEIGLAPFLFFSDY